MVYPKLRYGAGDVKNSQWTWPWKDRCDSFNINTGAGASFTAEITSEYNDLRDVSTSSDPTASSPADRILAPQVDSFSRVNHSATRSV
jgi:hypothetical protein